MPDSILEKRLSMPGSILEKRLSMPYSISVKRLSTAPKRRSSSAVKYSLVTRFCMASLMTSTTDSACFPGIPEFSSFRLAAKVSSIASIFLSLIL